MSTVHGGFVRAFQRLTLHNCQEEPKKEKGDEGGEEPGREMKCNGEGPLWKLSAGPVAHKATACNTEHMCIYCV